MTTKPILYVGLDGPLLIPHTHPDVFLKMGIAEYAKPFLHWAKDHFDVRYLTDRSPGEAFRLSSLLALPEDAIPVHGFEVSKTEVLEPRHDFYWIDSELIPKEVAWLAEHGHVNRFLPVDPMVGVRPEHKAALEQLTNKKRN